MPEPVKDAVRQGQLGDDLGVARGQIGMAEKDHRKFQFLDATGTRTARAREQGILHGGGNGFATARKTGPRRWAAATCETAAILLTVARLPVLLRGRTAFEALENFLIEVAAVVIGDLAV